MNSQLEICATAREIKADLIVIATRGYTGYQRAVLGSTASASSNTRPALFSSREHINGSNGSSDPRTRTGFRLNNILVPTDFSECSRAGLDYGLQLARDFKAELRLVHVINRCVDQFGDQHASLHAAQLVYEAANAAQKKMRSMAARANVRYSAQVIHGSPAHKICNAANEDVDLIVISTHGRTALGRLLVGSVAAHIVGYAHCPVLVIPAVSDSTQLS